MLSHVEKRPLHTMQCDPIDSECMHSLYHYQKAKSPSSVNTVYTMKYIVVMPFDYVIRWLWMCLRKSPNGSPHVEKGELF